MVGLEWYPCCRLKPFILQLWKKLSINRRIYIVKLFAFTTLRFSYYYTSHIELCVKRVVLF